jgi:hypothetical protein
MQAEAEADLIFDAELTNQLALTFDASRLVPLADTDELHTPSCTPARQPFLHLAQSFGLYVGRVRCP